MPAALSLLVLLAAFVFTAENDLRSRSDLRSSSSQLARASRDLASVRVRLAHAEKQLRSAKIENAAAGSSLSATQASLDATRKSLEGAQAGLYYQGYNLSTLDKCLSGVEQALNQLAVGQAPGALSSLNSVSASCRSASASGG